MEHFRSIVRALNNSSFVAKFGASFKLRNRTHLYTDTSNRKQLFWSTIYPESYLNLATQRRQIVGLYTVMTVMSVEIPSFVHLIRKKRTNTLAHKRRRESPANFSSRASNNQQDEEEKFSEPPKYSHSDWIGPIDKNSNIRKFKFSHSLDESQMEKEFRQLREETQEWNQEFWTGQNTKFVQAKDKFVKRKTKSNAPTVHNTEGTKVVLTPEEMAEFYTNFLAENREVFKHYNRSWYKRNLLLLWPALKVSVYKLFKQRKR